MRPKSLALLLLALGCGLVASIGITKVMTGGNGAGEGAGAQAGIFVAAADIPMGDRLTPESVKLQQWPKDRTPAGAISKIEDIKDRRVRTKLYAGEPILENRLVGKGVNEQGATAMIPVGYRVVPVKVDLVSGGSDLILPGDRVDVMVHLVRDKSRGIDETVTRTILQDIKVFAVNDTLDIEKEKDEQVDPRQDDFLVGHSRTSGQGHAGHADGNRQFGDAQLRGGQDERSGGGTYDRFAGSVEWLEANRRGPAGSACRRHATGRSAAGRAGQPAPHVDGAADQGELGQ